MKLYDVDGNWLNINLRDRTYLFDESGDEVIITARITGERERGKVLERAIMAWADERPPGFTILPRELSEMMVARTRTRYPGRCGPVTCSRILLRVPPWVKLGNTLVKGTSLVTKPASDGLRAWMPFAPGRGTLATMRDAYNAWAADHGYGTATSWSIRPAIDKAGYKVISRPHNVAVYARQSMIYGSCSYYTHPSVPTYPPCPAGRCPAANRLPTIHLATC